MSSDGKGKGKGKVPAPPLRSRVRPIVLSDSSSNSESVSDSDDEVMIVSSAKRKFRDADARAPKRSPSLGASALALDSTKSTPEPLHRPRKRARLSKRGALSGDEDEPPARGETSSPESLARSSKRGTRPGFATTSSASARRSAATKETTAHWPKRPKASSRPSRDGAAASSSSAAPTPTETLATASPSDVDDAMDIDPASRAASTTDATPEPGAGQRRSQRTRSAPTSYADRPSHSRSKPEGEGDGEGESMTAVPKGKGKGKLSSETYVPPDDEVSETADFWLPGEDDADVEVMDDDERQKPCRRLKKWVFWDQKSRKVIALEQLYYNTNVDIVCSGDVSPVFQHELEGDILLDDDEDYEGLGERDCISNNGPRLKTSALLFHVVDLTAGPILGKVWIQTSYAFYLLDGPPAPPYPAFADRFLRCSALVRAVLLIAADTPAPTLDHVHAFLESEERHADAQADRDTFGRTLGPSDLKKAAADVFDELSVLLDSEDGADLRNLQGSPLWSDLKRMAEPSRGGSHAHVHGGHLKRRPRVGAAPKQHPTVVTRRIKEIAGNLFGCKLVVPGEERGADVEDAEPSADVALAKWKAVLADDAPQSEFGWLGKPTHREEDEERLYYGAARLGEETIKPGDVVVIRPGADEDCVRTEAEQALLERQEALGLSFDPAHDKWFAKVHDLFQVGKGDTLLAQWFIHASRTAQAESAHPRHLCLLDEFEEISFDTVITKANVRKLERDQDEPRLKNMEPNSYFYAFLADEETGDFIDVDEYDSVRVTPQSLAQRRRAEKRRNVPTRLAGGIGFTLLDVYYDVGDFVYLQDAPVGARAPLYGLVQIVKINWAAPADGKPVVYGRKFGRMASLVWRNRKFSNITADEREIYLCSREHVKRITVNSLAGTFRAKHSAELADMLAWCAEPDQFWFDSVARRPIMNTWSYLDGCDRSPSPDDFEPIAPDDSALRLTHRAQDDEPHAREMPLATLRSNDRELNSLELCAGAGGLPCGLDTAGIVKTRWAVESDSAAARTFQHNFPDAHVYTTCVNAILKTAIDRDEGRATDGEHAPPEQGNVDMIKAGTPCQAFSSLNRFKKIGDPKAALVLNFASWVDHYRPNFGLLENVVGLVSHRLGKVKDDTKNGISEGDNGVLRVLLRALTSMGYQVRWGIVQAGDYGVPQSRHRLIVWAAKRGLKLPHLPRKTHAFEPSHRATIKLAMGRKFRVAQTSYAPHPAVTVGMAIGDIRGFDWDNPHVLRPQTHEQALDREQRAEFLKQLTVSSSTGFVKPVDYPHDPRTSFQEQARAHGGKLTQQLTGQYSNRIVELICSVPLEPAYAKGAKSGSIDHCGSFGRLSMHDFSRIMTTQVNPTGQRTTWLHPNQHRTITLREAARIQGFPDHFVFLTADDRPDSDVKKLYAQVGNAVPPPLGRALGRAFIEALSN